MNKPLLGSMIAATLLLGDASAATMYERFEAMEKEMLRLQNELADLKAEKAAASKPQSRGDEEADEEDEEDEAEGAAEYSEDEAEDEEEIDVMEEIEELQESVTELTKHTSGSHLKMDIDFRTSYDMVNYEMADGSRHENNALLSNRLWLNMNWAANRNISFTGQLAYHKRYGQRFGINPLDATSGSGFETFDWTGNENPNGDGSVYVKNAYYFYRNDTFLGTDIPWTFSLGRRPSTNGHLINLRENDPAASPSGHTINVEFDGLSSKFGLEKLTGVPGMYVKFCAGQGASDAQAMFSGTPYATNKADNTKDIHLGGLIFVPYDNGQFSVGTQFYGATNLIDLVNPGGDASNGFEDVGDLYSGSIYMMSYGIGNEWSEFLDDTTFFVSGAMSRSNPNDGQEMFGSREMENGYSYWVGLNMPSLISEEGRFGLEFNHGSKYWRSITYAEDTMIGSKVAARGDAYEAYFTEPLIDDILSMQIRYTYIDYDYAGSNGFFGGAADGSSGTGTPFAISDSMPGAGSFVDKAQDLRVYLRYRY